MKKLYQKMIRKEEKIKKKIETDHKKHRSEEESENDAKRNNEIEIKIRENKDHSKERKHRDGSGSCWSKEEKLVCLSS